MGGRGRGALVGFINTVAEHSHTDLFNSLFVRTVKDIINY